MAIVIEESYDFIKNAKGELMLIIGSKEKDPVRPRILFDRREVATLNRGQGQPVIKLVNLPDEIIDDLNDLRKILVCEITKQGSITQAYEASVRVVDI